MTTSFLFTQSPNRKGNISKHTATGTGGATGVTAQKHGTATPKGSQGAPKAGGDITGRHQKVSVSTHADYCGTIKNDGYMSKSVKNYGG